jgi:hypothetical protein
MKRYILLAAVFCMELSARPNPAYVYCIENGGVIETRKDSQGNEDGVCIFDVDASRSECGQWSFFRGECSPGHCKVWTVESNSCLVPMECSGPRS